MRSGADENLPGILRGLRGREGAPCDGIRGAGGQASEPLEPRGAHPERAGEEGVCTAVRSAAEGTEHPHRLRPVHRERDHLRA